MMLNNKTIPVESIIAKIDNDFNPDNSDWIPRVIAWTVDAMSQLNILRTVNKDIKLAVVNRIARSYCSIDSKVLKVYDSNGCEIGMAGRSCYHPLTGDRNRSVLQPTPSDQVSIVDTNYTGPNVYDSIAIHTNSDVPAEQHIVKERYNTTPRRGSGDRNYVLADNRTIELNFDTDYIIVRTQQIETVYSDYYRCEVPTIPNIGILVEAIGYYCMYKMLCRGMKHPVFNLAASQYGTNPYYIWMQLKDKAKIAVINGAQDEAGGDNGAWRSYFYNYTFPKG